jgi:hypothetical protein
MMVTGHSKRQARPPLYHFEKLHEETCPNHAYLVKHKLRDCSMMNIFMTSVSLSPSMEVNEVSNEGDTMHFLEKIWS